MAKLTSGQVMPDFPFDTPFESGLTLSQTVSQSSGKTAQVFLRYYGCPLCQYDIHQYAKQYEALTRSGGQLLVVLQSDPAALAARMTPDSLPFRLVCDPKQTLYRQFDISPAPSQAKMAGPKTLIKLAKVTASGYKHGEYEGEELQLPAVFVMTRERKLEYVHYGKTVDDVPGPKELAQLLK